MRITQSPPLISHQKPGNENEVILSAMIEYRCLIHVKMVPLLTEVHPIVDGDPGRLRLKSTSAMRAYG